MSVDFATIEWKLSTADWAFNDQLWDEHGAWIPVSLEHPPINPWRHAFVRQQHFRIASDRMAVVGVLALVARRWDLYATCQQLAQDYSLAGDRCAREVGKPSLVCFGGGALVSA